MTQGSGVYVDGSGSVTTAAHLLRVYNQLFVVGTDGKRRPATVIKQSATDDIAILRVSSPPDGGVSPVTFAAAPPARSDVVRIEGYWNKGIEPERGWNLFGPERPDFKAAVQGKAAPVRGVVDSATDSGIVLLAAVGRGAYGGPAVNSCGRVVGIVNRGPSASDADLWKPHVIEPRVAVLPSNRVVALLRDAGIKPSVAEKDCKAEVAAKTEESKKETEDAKKKAADAEKKRKAAERQAKEAEKKAKEAEQQKDRAEKEAEQVKKDTTKAVEGLSERIGEKDVAIKVEQERRRQYMIYGAIAVGVLLLLSLLLWIKRRKDLRSAEAELEVANARFSDCLLEGMDFGRRSHRASHFGARSHEVGEWRDVRPQPGCLGRRHCGRNRKPAARAPARARRRALSRGYGLNRRHAGQRRGIGAGSGTGPGGYERQGGARRGSPNAQNI